MSNNSGSDPSDLEAVVSVDWNAVEADLKREIGEDYRRDGRVRSERGRNGVDKRSA